MDASDRYITLNVGGKLFVTTAATLKNMPNTRLGRLAAATATTPIPNIATTNTTTTTAIIPSNSNRQDNEFFFDRNPDIINSLLDLYRTGDLHLPRNMCGSTAAKELEFWEIPTQLIRECCFSGFEEHLNNAKITAEIDTLLTTAYDSPTDIKNLSNWNRIWLIMELPKYNRASKVWAAIFYSFVVASVLLFCLETSMTFRIYRPWFLSWVASQNTTVESVLSSLEFIKRYSVTFPDLWLRRSHETVFAFFLLEFFGRLITCPNKAAFFKQGRNWLDMFMLSQNCMTVVMEEFVIPLTNMNSLSPGEVDALFFFYSLSIVRVLRIFYLTQHYNTMKILLLSIKASLRVLILLTICVTSLALMFGASVFLTELLAQKSTFDSILYGMWYAIVTMTTVGYGDVFPVSVAGRIIGMLCALSGVIVMALPVAVIASSFTSYHNNMAARVHIRTRLAFLKDNPDFCTNNNNNTDDDKKELSAQRPTSTKTQYIQKRKHSDSFEDDLKQDKESGDLGDGSFVNLCIVQQKLNDCDSSPVKVSEYTESVCFKEAEVSKVVTTRATAEKNTRNYTRLGENGKYGVTKFKGTTSRPIKVSEYSELVHVKEAEVSKVVTTRATAKEKMHDIRRLGKNGEYVGTKRARKFKQKIRPFFYC